VQSGQPAQLFWNSQGAHYAWLSEGPGALALNGTMTVFPISTRTYTLTVTDYLGRVNTCQTTIFVSAPPPFVSLQQIPYTGIGFGPFGDAAVWFSVIVAACAGLGALVYSRVAAR
jgi:hypothetical protein